MEVRAPAPPVAQPEADPVDETPLADAWREWFRRVGEHANSEVVNATATLVIAERKALNDRIRASTTTPSAAAVEAEKRARDLPASVAQYQTALRIIDMLDGWRELDTFAPEWESKEEMTSAVAAVLARYLPAHQPVEEAISSAIIQTQHEWRLWLWNEFQIDAEVSNNEARERLRTRVATARADAIGEVIEAAKRASNIRPSSADAVIAALEQLKGEGSEG